MVEQLSLFPEGETQGTEMVMGSAKQIKQPEWCFQFFDNDPVIFGWNKDNSEATELIIKLRPLEEDVLTFSQNGMVFKIFAREMTEEGNKLRQQTQQNGSENQEAAQ